MSGTDITGAGVGKYYGTAEKAEALQVGSDTVPFQTLLEVMLHQTKQC